MTTQGKHCWKGAIRRNSYTVILSPRLGWVRLFWAGKSNMKMVPL